MVPWLAEVPAQVKVLGGQAARSLAATVVRTRRTETRSLNRQLEEATREAVDAARQAARQAEAAARAARSLEADLDRRARSAATAAARALRLAAQAELAAYAYDRARPPSRIPGCPARPTGPDPRSEGITQ